MDAEPGPQTAEQERDLRSLGAAVHVRFVEDEEELLPSCWSHCLVSSKMGRSNGRISMYSSIE